jgi:hypothetical protein
MMRLKSNYAQGTFNQLRVTILHGLTYKLYSLYYQVEAIKSELEVRFTFPLFTMQSMTASESQVKIDRQQLSNNMEIITSAEVPRPADGKRVLIQPWMLTNYDSTMVS